MPNSFSKADSYVKERQSERRQVPLAEEGLLIPFYMNGKAVGAIWAIAHSDARKFDAEDLRLLESMGRFASTAYQAAESVEVIKLEIAARERVKVELELAHANRVETIGHLSASIAHEITQPVAAAVNNASAGLRWLDKEPPDLEQARQALNRIFANGNRASGVIGRMRALLKKAPLQKEDVDINEAILEVIALTRAEVTKNGISVQTQYAERLPFIRGDRVQLQQVILNLIINAVEALSSVGEGPRELIISTGETESNGVLVAVRDSGPGLAPESAERMFESFYTTKPSGLGMGLSICRSIVEAHQGRLWACSNTPRGAIFQFTLPSHLHAELSDA